VTLRLSRKLFARARTSSPVNELSWEELDALISPSAFHERKANQILAIAREMAERFGETLPRDRDVLLSFAGLGPKCANLVLGVVHGTPVISVDIHVHRVRDRWDYLKASTPEKTLLALEAHLPQRHWIDINRLLVSLVNHIELEQDVTRRPRNNMCKRHYLLRRRFATRTSNLNALSCPRQSTEPPRFYSAKPWKQSTAPFALTDRHDYYRNARAERINATAS
jgi:endonuclease III